MTISGGIYLCRKWWQNSPNLVTLYSSPAPVVGLLLEELIVEEGEGSIVFRQVLSIIGFGVIVLVFGKVVQRYGTPLDLLFEQIRFVQKEDDIRGLEEGVI